METNNNSSKDISTVGGGRTYPLNDVNNVLKADKEELKKRFFKNTQNKKPIKKITNKNNKKIKRSHSSKSSFFESGLGIDNASSIEPRVFNLNGNIGEEDAHFIGTK